MRGIATVDRQPESDSIAIWITNWTKSPISARHFNAVVINASEDPRFDEKVISLTRQTVVLLTEGSTLVGFPIEGRPLNVDDLGDLMDETEYWQERIVTAVETFRGPGKSPVPTFPDLPSRKDFSPAEDTASARAFATANFVRRAWTYWLASDEERRRRTVRPRTGETPWIMPEEMNLPDLAIFPPGFAGRIHVQPLV
jgi:hypothetical protein